MKKICFPTDFSELSLAALPLVQQLSKKCDAELHLIHVITSGLNIETGDDLLEDVHQKAALKKFEDVKNKFGLDSSSHSTCMHGKPIEKIIHYAENNNIDIIFMPTHGYSGITRLLLGNVTNKVLRQSPIPVFVVNPKTQKAFDLDNVNTVIAATDFSKLSNAALPFAAHLALALKTELNLTHVLSDCNEMVGVYGDSFDLIPHYGSFSGYLSQQRERAKLSLQKLKNKLNSKYPDLKVRATLIDGDPDERLLSEGENNSIMVMSTHGYSEFENIVIGSTTEAVIQEASTPVVSVRPRHPFEDELSD